jgi:iron complex outermembrane recepter protein
LGVAGCASPSPILTTTSPFTGSQTIFPSPQGTSPATAFFGTDQSFNFTTPRIIVNYKIDADKLIYATFAQGAKTGGFNTGLNVFVDQRTYQPEYSDNYEVGLKTDWMDRKLRLNLAGYFVNWRNQQAACQNPITAGGSSTNRTYTCNVAASHIYGLEAELVIRPVEYFTLSASYTYTHARYTRFVDATLNGTPGTLGALALAGLPNIDFNGKSLPYVPDHKLVVSPRFTVPLGDVKLEARADIQYQSRTFLRADNFQSFGAKTVVDLRIGADLGLFRVQAFANNVFNDRTPTAAVRFFDSVNYSVSSPLVTGANLRQYGITVGAKF